MKAADEVGKDHICRLIFLNLVVDEEKVVSHHLKEPFKTALESKVVLNGRRTDPLNEPVLDTLHSLLLNFSGIQSRLKSLNLVLEGIRSKPATDLQFLL